MTTTLRPLDALRSGARRALAACALVTIALGSAACSDDGGGEPSLFNGLRGSLQQIAGRLGPEFKRAQVSLMVGKQQIAPTVDPTSQRFVFENLPAGPKTLVVRADGKVRTLKFAKSARAPQALTSMIPETNATQDTFDLGEVRLTDQGHLQPQNNPLADVVDTDGDGTADYHDDDIDGDGTSNDSDDAPFGDAHPDVAWSDGCHPAWDDDGDGVHDWESAANDAGFWNWDAVAEMDICALDDLECWMQLYCDLVPTDGLCTGEGFAPGATCSDVFDCAQYCDDAVCVEGCFAEASPATQQVAFDIVACADACGTNELCLLQQCTLELSTCFGDEG